MRRRRSSALQGYCRRFEAAVIKSIRLTVNYSYLQNSTLLSGYTLNDPASSIQHQVSRTYEPHRDLITSIQNTFDTNTISRFDYLNDAVGRRTERIDYNAQFMQALTNLFDYNPRSELTSAAMSTNDYQYQYDPIGNRKQASLNAVTNFYAANQLNQYTNILEGGAPAAPLFYDADGNLTNYADWTFTWNGENRLIQASNGTIVVNNTYDYMGRRIQKTTKNHAQGTTNQTQFVYDGWNMIAESDGAATPSSRYYIWGLDLSGTLQGAGGVGGLIAVVETADEPFFACYDANGNITEYVDTNGTVAAYYQYDPYGNIMQASGTKAGEMAYRFSTKYLDAEADMYYYGYRYYNPEIGRWISRDPIEERGGINLFNLLQGDSINYVDPFGLRWLGTVIMAPSVITASNFLEAAGKMNGKFRTDHPVWFNTVSESSSPTDQKDSSCSSCKMYSCKYEKTIEAAGFADIEHGEYSGGDAWDQAYWGKAHARAMQHEMEHAKIAENWVNRVGTETVSATASKCDSSAQLCDKAKKAVDDRLAEFKKLQFGIHANEQKVFEGKDTPLAQQYIAQLMNQYRNQHP